MASLAILPLALWLIASPVTLGYTDPGLIATDLAGGALLCALSLVPAPRSWVGWAAGAIGLWVMTAPLVFWAPGAAAYNNETLIGALIVIFAVVVPRWNDGTPTRPPGWTYNPSGWPQRLPIVLFALMGFFTSRYMAAYQLGHIDQVWDPFFGDGTRRVLESSISKWFPVSDAGLGALSYLLDALAGLIGGERRWKTMPWMVVLFGFLIIPPGVTSIVLVILQPAAVGAWCTLCLITAVFMLMMVPPALDEVLASAQFLQRVRRSGGSVWRAFWLGEGDALEQPILATHRSRWREMIHGAEILSMPGTLLASALIGVAIMAAPGIFGLEGRVAVNDYVVGALVTTFAVIASAEPARGARLLNVLLGAWLMVAPWILGGGTTASILSDMAAGLLVAGLSLPRGKIEERYGQWDARIV